MNTQHRDEPIKPVTPDTEFVWDMSKPEWRVFAYAGKVYCIAMEQWLAFVKEYFNGKESVNTAEMKKALWEKYFGGEENVNGKSDNEL